MNAEDELPSLKRGMHLPDGSFITVDEIEEIVSYLEIAADTVAALNEENARLRAELEKYLPRGGDDV